VGRNLGERRLLGCRVDCPSGKAGVLPVRPRLHADGRQRVKPIGAEQIDRTFLETYTRQDIDTFMYAAVDPLNTIVKWVMPGKAWILQLPDRSMVNRDVGHQGRVSRL
jgi:hypothetical protein